jgi:two-component sensor histidine kinase
MVSNAIKHGMNGMKEGNITVRGREEEGEVIVEVVDSGNQPLSPLEEESGEGLGLSLIRNLIGDLGGQFMLHHTDETPARTSAEVRFSLTRLKRRS